MRGGGRRHCSPTCSLTRFTADSHARRSKYRGPSCRHCIIDVGKTFLRQPVVDARHMLVERSHEPWKNGGHRAGAADGTSARPRIWSYIDAVIGKVSLANFLLLPSSIAHEPLPSAAATAALRQQQPRWRLHLADAAVADADAR
jgi:hypothetical protein